MIRARARTAPAALRSSRGGRASRLTVSRGELHGIGEASNAILSHVGPRSLTDGTAAPQPQGERQTIIIGTVSHVFLGGGPHPGHHGPAVGPGWTTTPGITATAKQRPRPWVDASR